jgi:hypothetical protein
MRSHGIPNFPDPILGGHFGIDAASGIDPDTPQFKAAYHYCGTRYLHLHPPSPAELAQRNVAAVKYSHCMRAHDVSDFPDPDGQGRHRPPDVRLLQHTEGAARSSSLRGASHRRTICPRRAGPVDTFAKVSSCLAQAVSIRARPCPRLGNPPVGCGHRP